MVRAIQEMGSGTRGSGQMKTFFYINGMVVFVMTCLAMLTMILAGWKSRKNDWDIAMIIFGLFYSALMFRLAGE
jgi:hypothetical protein